MEKDEIVDGQLLESVGVLALLGIVLKELRHARLEIKALKFEVDKFLRPQIRFVIGNQIVKGIKMKDTEKVVASLEIDDAKGFPTGQGFDQPPVWSIDDATIATLNPSADGLTCEVVAQVPGNAKLSVAGVAGGQSYVGAAPVSVVAGDAVAIKVSLGAPVAQ